MGGEERGGEWQVTFLKRREGKNVNLVLFSKMGTGREGIFFDKKGGKGKGKNNKCNKIILPFIG